MQHHVEIPEQLHEHHIKNILVSPDHFDKDTFDKLKDQDGFVSRAQFLGEVNARREEQLEAVYRLFAAPNDEMTKEKFAKMLKDSKIIDKRTFKAIHSDRIFTSNNRNAPNPKVMSYETFRKRCIKEIAEQKGPYFSEHDVITTLSLCPGPVASVVATVKEDTGDAKPVRRPSIQRNSSAEKIQAVARGKIQRSKLQRIDSARVIDASVLSDIVGNVRNDILHASFLRFAPSGDMDGRTFSKMMDDSGITCTKFSAIDADIVFGKCKKVAAGGGSVVDVHTISFLAFESVALEPIAEQLGIRIEEVVSKLSLCEGPIIRDASAIQEGSNSLEVASVNAGVVATALPSTSAPTRRPSNAAGASTTAAVPARRPSRAGFR